MSHIYALYVCLYARLVCMQGPVPGPISNHRLLKKDGITPKEGLEMAQSYRGVNKQVWTDRQTDRQPDRERQTETDRQTDKTQNTHTHTHYISTRYAIHDMLYTICYIVYTLYYILYSIYYILYTVDYTLYTIC